MSKSIRKIIFVDDVETVRKVLRKKFESIGTFEIIEAANGEEAYRLVIAAQRDGSPFDLVISDWNMPKMDGLQLLKSIRKNEAEEIKWCKFIMVTGDGEKVKSALNFGANTYISKPFAVEDLAFKMDLLSHCRLVRYASKLY